MTTQVVNDQAVTETRMRRPLLGVLRNACAQLPFHEQILDEAFVDHADKLCVPRQLAVLLKMSLDDVCNAFDTMCADGWRLRGVSPHEIFEYAKFYGCPCFYWAGGQMVATYEPQHKLNRALAFTSWEDHAFCLPLCYTYCKFKGKAERGRRHPD